MLVSLWEFYKTNREAVAGIGAGLVVVIGGGWAVFKYIDDKDDKPKPPPRDVRADHGSVAVGGDATNSPISIDNSRRPER